MIKFFRHIRKSLLEQNKMGKYFKYAIGEIILVVIGILIALQINNWNEKQKQNKEEQRVLNNIKKDILKDTVQLNRNIKTTIKRDSALVAIIDLLAPEKGHNVNEFIKLSMNNIPFDNYFEVNSGTYDESIASGSIKYISNDTLRQKIFDYYRNAKLNLNDKGNIEQSKLSLPLFFEKLMVSKDVLAMFGSKSRLRELDLIELGKDKEFMRLLIEKLGNHNQQRKSWKGYLNLGEDLLKEIDSDVKNN